jgi:tripartite-type tricarboxylate transporter receptor subunit TctC
VNINRKTFLMQLGGALTALDASFAIAQSGGGTITIVVPYAPGGAADLTARLLAQKLSERLARTVLVENKSGAAGQIGTQFVVRAEPDGNTLVLSPSGSISVTGHFKKLPYDPLKDLAAVALLAYVPSAIAVPASSSYKTLNDLLDAAKRNQAGVSYGVAGVGTHMHLSGELLSAMTGTKLVPIAYRGDTPSVAALVAGETDACIAGLGALQPMAKAGRIRILALTNSRRTSTAPNIPTAAESGVKGYSANAWIGMFAPAGTPDSVAERLNTEIAQIVRLADVKAALATAGLEPASMSIPEFIAFLVEDSKRWGALIRERGIKAE